MLGLEVVLGVGDIEAPPLPLIGFLLSIFLKRVHKRLHSLRVARFILLQVHEVEPICEPYKYKLTFTINITFLNITHAKVEPLSIVECIKIKVKVQVIFVLVHFFNFSQVTRLESRVEKECGFSQKPEGYWQLYIIVCKLR